MKKLLFCILLIAGVQAFAQDITVNDPNAEKRNLNASFHAIKVSDGIELFLTQGNEESVAVSASEDKYKDRLKTEVEDGTLKIYYDKALIWNDNEKRKLKVYVSFKTLNRIKASSGSGIEAKTELSLDKLQLDLSSGSQFEGKINIGELEVSQGSGSEVEISGKANNLNVDLGSGAMFKGFDLSVDYCNAKASSGGQVLIHVNKELNAKASSGGDIKYRGEGTLTNLDVSSGGSVKKS